MGSDKIWTIEVGEKNIKLCEVEYGGSVVYRTVSFLTPAETVYDGYIVAIDKLGEYLKEKLKEARIFIGYAVFSLASASIISREVEIPYAKDKWIKKLSLSKAEECFTFDLEDCIITPFLIDKSRKENKMRINLLAAPKDLIAGYFNLAKKLEIKVESIDYIGNAIFQILNIRLKKESALVVNLGDSISVASIVDEGKVRMQKSVVAGARKSFCRFEKEGEVFSDEIEGQENISMTEREFEILSTSMSEMLEYYQENNAGKHITKVYIVGEGSLVSGLAEKMERVLKITTVSMRQAFGTVVGRSGGDMSKGNVDSCYISCMGAGINPLDIIFEEIIIAKERQENFVIFRRRVIKFILFLLVLLFLCRINFTEARYQSMELQNQIKEKSYSAGMYENYSKSKMEYEYLHKFDKATEKYNDNLLTLLMELEKKLPKGAGISSFESGDKGIFLSVKAREKKTLAKFIVQMRNIKYIENLEVSEIKYSEKTKNYTMKMSCSYKEQEENLGDE